MPIKIYSKWSRKKICIRCRLVYNMVPGVICGDCGNMLSLTIFRSVYEKHKWLGLIPYDKFVGIQIKGENA